MAQCYHCGDPCDDKEIKHKDKSFCCQGCATVFDILHESDLSYYYDLESTPGISPGEVDGKFDFLDNESIAEKLLEFHDGDIKIVSFLIPSIHCSSCIWVLENLQKLNAGVRTSQVDFPKKTVRITYASEEVSLKELVTLLARLGYEPYISLENADQKKKQVNRTLIYQLGIAGFAFGNVMFLSFPEYFQVEEFWLDRFKHLFRWLMFAYSVPVVFYSAKDYFISAYKGLRSKILNIDVPIALGILVLFLRSTLEIVMDWGTGFFDSLTGLVFFLLVGKFFQQKTYSYLSFERDYKSYFPIAITRIKEDHSEEQVPIYEVLPGDRLLVRNKELLPVDAILLKGDALIDYSFVTGEAVPVHKDSGDKLFAGGRQEGGIIEVQAMKGVEQSYLTQLWSNEVFSTNKQHLFQSLTDRISKNFTIGVLSLAFLATLFWLVVDPSKAFQVFTAVLIVACPCAIALASPFTLGNLLRIFGKQQLYLKESYIIEQMAQVDTVVFDKTGTITTHQKSKIIYEGIPLTEEESAVLTSSLRASNHPLSRALYDLLNKNNITTLDSFEEVTGKGILATHKNRQLKIGAASFVEAQKESLEETNETSVYVSSNDGYKGRYVFQNTYRKGLMEVFQELGKDKKLVILSGDNDGERERLQMILPKHAVMLFEQKPDDKLQYIKNLQKSGKKVMMVGDGLNDAGALAQSDVGIVISENVNVFSPACDGILDASRFQNLTDFFQISKKGMKIIKWSFVLSLIYNLIGLSFAVSGNLSPVVAAILMPLSSISIVVFTTVATYFIGKKLAKKETL
ncbi:MAG: heavy metal translocating P-type ATPase [Flavobacteriaceae bacterium]|nr:heavy metal translocating P-type ATPase [Flavobacteriaceae bacterium]|tara:strand:+ start:136434 stop:138824 length:2391 start_codon:yes stop_codon:yes gene_type:complete